MKKYHLAILSLLLFGFVCALQPALAGQIKVIKVIVGSANVRVKPDFTSQVITRLPLGTLLELTAKTGDWYQISVSPDEKGASVTGYIHQSTVQEAQATPKPVPETTAPAKAPQPVPTPREPQDTAMPAAPTTTGPAAPGGNLFSGFFIKLGWMASPDAGGFGKSWLSSFGYDFGFRRNFAFGIELQPAYRSYPEIDLSIFPVMGFANIKAGENMGRLVPFLRFLNLLGGIGIGLEASHATTHFNNQTYTNFKTNFAFHLLFGAEIDFKTFKLLMDYQMTQVSDPDVNPNFWRNYLLFGIRF